MMIAIISEKKVQNRLLNIFHERKGDTPTNEGAYTTTSLIPDKSVSIISDVRDDSGILFTKIALEELIPYIPDLSIFDEATKQLEALDESVVDILNEYDTDLSYAPSLTTPMYDTGNSTRLLTLFKRTRVLLGLGNLCYSEATLVESGDYFYITASPDCPFYTGTLKVKIK